MIAIWVKNGCSQQLRVFEKPEISIGRAEENDIALPCADVSRRHCKILLVSTTFHLLDLTSRNGTFVNGRRIPTFAVVSASDEIQVGTIRLLINDELLSTHHAITPRPTTHRVPRLDPGNFPELIPSEPVTQMGAGELRHLIEQTLPLDGDLDAFCIDYFPSAKRQFTSQMHRTSKVNYLLEYVDHGKLFALLISRQNNKDSPIL